ncbi:MAG: preprotein translocase subunit YajC [Anaerohalosphaeraceae bacterium]|nr:preprotein translocase subunit YajC [Anaerohalosphaeraceae bacterium]
MDNIWMIAETEVVTSEPIDVVQTETTSTTQQADPNSVVCKPAPKSNPIQFVFIGLIFVMLYFVMFRGPKKKQQQQKKMVDSLKKNDRVQTIGGILGTVIDINESEVTIKIDESNNTKMKLQVNAISRVIEQN